MWLSSCLTDGLTLCLSLLFFSLFCRYTSGLAGKGNASLVYLKRDEMRKKNFFVDINISKHDGIFHTVAIHEIHLKLFKYIRHGMRSCTPRGRVRVHDH